MKASDPTSSPKERDHRCDCGAVICRLTARGVEIKCRRCKRVVVVLAVQETSEYLGNVTGGTHRGFQYDGLTQAVLQVNTQRAFGWFGGTFNVSGLHVHGDILSADKR